DRAPDVPARLRDRVWTNAPSVAGAVTPTAVAALVPRALAAFRRAHPEIASSLVEGLTPALLDRLLAGDADVAVVSCVPADEIDRSRFDLRHLLDERLLVAVSREHRLAGRRTVRLAELADDSFIAGSATAEETLLRASLPSGFRPRIDIVAAEWTGKLGCVAAGLGVALVPALAARGTPADITLLRLRDEDVAGQLPGGEHLDHGRAPADHRRFA
ncbi:LysR substrate-binding domain-containing protein, partial [Micromonospora zhanjiangensis]